MVCTTAEPHSPLQKKNLFRSIFFPRDFGARLSDVGETGGAKKKKDSDGRTGRPSRACARGGVRMKSESESVGKTSRGPRRRRTYRQAAGDENFSGGGGSGIGRVSPLLFLFSCPAREGLSLADPFLSPPAIFNPRWPSKKDKKKSSKQDPFGGGKLRLRQIWLQVVFVTAARLHHEHGVSPPRHPEKVKKKKKLTRRADVVQDGVGPDLSVDSLDESSHFYVFFFKVFRRNKETKKKRE